MFFSMKRSLVAFVAFGLLAGLLAVVGCDESDEIVVLETEIRQLELENTRLDVLSRNLEARILQLETTLETYLSGQLEESDSGELVEGIPYSIPKPDGSAGDGDGTVILPQEVLGFGTGQWRVGVDIRPGVYKSEASDDGYSVFCEWETRSNYTGDYSSINNDGGVLVLDAPIYAEIFESDVIFDTSGCKPWIRIDD